MSKKSFVISLIPSITSFFVLHSTLTPNKVYAYNISTGPVLQIADSSTSAKTPLSEKILTARSYYFQRVGIGGYAAIYGDIVPLISYNICMEPVYNLVHKAALMANTEKTFYEFFRKKSKKTKPDKDLNYQFDKYLPLVWLKYHSLYCPITFKILLNIGPYFSTYLGSILNIKYFLKTEIKDRSYIEEKVYWSKNFVPTKKYSDLYFNLGAILGIRACTLGDFLDLDLCILSITACLYNTNTDTDKNKTKGKYKHHIGMELSTQISLRCDILSLIYMPERKRYIPFKDVSLDY